MRNLRSRGSGGIGSSLGRSRWRDPVFHPARRSSDGYPRGNPFDAACDLSFLFPVEEALFHDLVDEEDVGEERPQVDGRVQVVDELGADRGLGQGQPQAGARLFFVLLQDVDEGIEALSGIELLALDDPSKEVGEPDHRLVAPGKEPPELASALPALVAIEPLSGVGEHELVALFDGIDAFLQVFERHGRMGEHKNPLSTWEGWRGENEFTESSLPRSRPSDPGRGGRDSPSWWSS